jgi:hypothetical protein
MKNKKSNEHQVLKVLKDYNAGKSGLELLRNTAFTARTFLN